MIHQVFSGISANSVSDRAKVAIGATCRDACGCETASVGRHFQARDSADNHDQEEHPPRCGWLSVKKDSEYGGSNCPNSRPDGVAGSDGNCSDCDCQQCHADDHGRDREHAGPELCEAMSRFQADRPANFKDRCDEKTHPIHKSPEFSKADDLLDLANLLVRLITDKQRDQCRSQSDGEYVPFAAIEPSIRGFGVAEVVGGTPRQTTS